VRILKTNILKGNAYHRQQKSPAALNRGVDLFSLLNSTNTPPILEPYGSTIEVVWQPVTYRRMVEAIV
jgi:hypothetical protein